MNPDPCVLRQGWMTVESYPSDLQGVFQVVVDEKLIGENPPGAKKQFPIFLTPRK